MSVQLPEDGQGNAKVSRSLLVQRRAGLHHRPVWGVTSIHAVWEAAMTGIQGFVTRENIKYLHHELEGGADPIRRATLLKPFGRGRRSLRPYGEQLGKLDRHISRSAEIITRQVKLTDDLKDLLRSGPS